MPTTPIGHNIDGTKIAELCEAMSRVTRMFKSIVPASWRKKMAEAQLRREHGGGELECNYCGARLRNWTLRGQPAEVIERLDIVPAGPRFSSCPFCGSYDRDRLLLMFLERRTDLFTKPTKLLHIAPEQTLARTVLQCPSIDYISGDLDGALAMRALDVTDIDFPENTFDAIICNHVLEHVPNDRLAMSELLRVLKPGGWAVLQVPIGIKLDKTIEDFNLPSDADRLEKFGQGDHVRVYSMDDYVERLRSVGWLVEVSDFPAEVGPQMVHRFGLHEREKVVFCRKAS